jgi:hypothetical protein
MSGSITTVPMRLAPYQGIFVVFRKAASSIRQDGKNFKDDVIVQTLNDSWMLRFDTKFGGPEKPVSYEQLQDLTASSEPAIKHYSGTVVYRKEFNLDTPHKGKLFLDLGIVHDLAAVRLNGNNLGTVWCAPWKIDVTRFVKSKGNVLEIEVTNTWWNRLVYEAGLPVEQRLTKSNATWIGANSELLPSGLLGPVRLCTERIKL